MNDWLEITAKTVEDAMIEAAMTLGISSDQLEYEVIEKESAGFLGLMRKPAKIRAKSKKVELSAPEAAKEFLGNVFRAMNVSADIEIDYNEEEKNMYVNVQGEDMGVLIGKRGQTLDSLQYLVSLVVNKGNEGYIKVKLDTENYRERRKETLENLARNIASKVRKTGRSVSLEPMNPYERRIIHSALQNDKYVETHSEGEEPYRKVVVTLKKGVKVYPDYNRYGKNGYKGDDNKGYHNKSYNNKSYNKGYNRGGYHKTYNRKESSFETKEQKEVSNEAE